MKLWLDDDERGFRNPPDSSWTWCKSVNQAKALIIETLASGGQFEEADLDHDLGEHYSKDGGDGIELINWMDENDYWPNRAILIHSMNPIGVQNMLRAIDASEKFEAGYFSNRRYRRT